MRFCVFYGYFSSVFVSTGFSCMRARKNFDIEFFRILLPPSSSPVMISRTCCSAQFFGRHQNCQRASEKLYNRPNHITYAKQFIRRRNEEQSRAECANKKSRKKWRNKIIKTTQKTMEENENGAKKMKLYCRLCHLK